MTTSALQSLQPPVLLRLQHLPHERHVFVADRRGRAGSADRRRWRAATARAGRARSRRSSSALARSEPSVPSTRDASRSNSRASSAEMPRWRRPLWACVSASANVRAGGAGIAILPRERLDRLAIRGHAGREAEPHGGARRQPDPLAQADDRIEHDAGRARERASVERQRDRRGSGRGRESARDRFPIRAAPAAGLRGSARGTPRPAASPGSRGRRWQSSAALSGRYSVSTKSLPNAGCARSSAADARTISA